MEKLFALAALAATGASFAQVTISGNLTTGFQQSVTNSYTVGAPINFIVPTDAQLQGMGAFANPASNVLAAGATLSTSQLVPTANSAITNATAALNGIKATGANNTGTIATATALRDAAANQQLSLANFNTATGQNLTAETRAAQAQGLTNALSAAAQANNALSTTELNGLTGFIASVNANLPKLTGASSPARLTTQQMGASGFGVDTAEIFITAKEDVGGGQTVEAVLGLDNVSRGNGFGAHDVKLTYTNMSFGRIQYGNTRGGAVFSGYPSAGAPVIDMDGKLFELRSYSEYINYAAPVGPITLVYQLGESTAGTGLGAGQSGTPAVVGQRSNMLLGLYRDGPLEAFLAFKTYDNGDAASITGVNALTKDRQWSVQGAYDFGAAKVGFGYAYTTANVGATVSDMLLGLNVPMGALEVGATWGREVVSGITGVPHTAFTATGNNLEGAIAKAILSQAEGTATGWSVGAKYNLSKRTHFKLNHAAWTRSGYAQFEAYALAKKSTDPTVAANAAANLGYAPIETQTNLLLSHSF